MKKFLAIFCLFGCFLAACVDHNVTLYSPDGKTSTKCQVAVAQDEGSVCFKGYQCDNKELSADQGCWTESKWPR